MTTHGSGLLVIAQSSRINWEPRILTNSLWIVGFLLLGAIVIALVEHWRKNIRDQRVSPSQQLAHFRKLREEGKISPEEFEALRIVLGGRIRRSLEEAPNQTPETTESSINLDNKTSDHSTGENKDQRGSTPDQTQS